MIEVKKETDGTFTITWDENDPIESQLNTWTEEDFIKCLLDACKETEDVQQTALGYKHQQDWDVLG